MTDETNYHDAALERMQDSVVPRAIQNHPYVLEIERETFELVALVTEILNEHDLWGPDDTYTWKDGTRWAKFDPTSHKK